MMERNEITRNGRNKEEKYRTKRNYITHMTKTKQRNKLVLDLERQKSTISWWKGQITFAINREIKRKINKHDKIAAFR